MDVYRQKDQRDASARMRYEALRNKYIGVDTIEQIDALAANTTLKNFGMSDD